MRSDNHSRVLVLDGDMDHALTISRSLSRRKCQVDVASSVDRPLCSYSRHIDTRYTYPDPLSSEGKFLEWLAQLTGSEDYDLVIPVTERTLVPISRNRQLFRHSKVAMPSQESLEIALDKAKTLQLARELDIPIPESVLIESSDHLSKSIATLGYPVVIKPSRSVGVDDEVSSQLKVSYAFDEDELRAGCEHALRFGPVLLQQLFRGQGVGIELIARDGKTIYAFQHLRVHEVPLSGGGSSLRVSVPLEPTLLEAAERLIDAMDWTGVAMVEFKWNASTAEYSLMEINGRFWGSLPLADAAGADFPSMLLDLELAGRVSASRPYRPGVYCRKLSSDLQWYEAVLRSGSDDRIADIPDGWTILKQIGLIFSPRHYFDVQSFRDPLPGIVDIGRIAQFYFRRITVLVQELSFLRTQRKAWRQGHVASALKSASSVLFVCYGNINRSALADVLFRSYAEDIGLTVSSAGFHQRAGRPADPIMVDIARGRGFSLEQSRSIVLDQTLLKACDVVFVMEKSHYDKIGQISPDSLSKTWLLGAHCQNRAVSSEISDPFGCSRNVYERTYDRISGAVDCLKSILACQRDL